ncbi:MAG: hypothetical protein GX624_07570 [Actinobacteria bacterium]|nr:hypothetical protein [Actinomycetota bacterium]
MRYRQTLRRIAVPLLLAALVLVPAIVPTAAGAAPWTPVTTPWSASDFVGDIATFGATGLAAAGDEGRIYVSRNGGKSWDVVVPPGREATVFTAVDFTGAGAGAVASGGLLLVTADGGATWRLPSYVGGGGPASINDIAMRGSDAVAVGDDGVILESADGGLTWSRADSPLTGDLTSVAVASDGTSVAGTRGGQVLMRRDGVWTVAHSAAAPVSSVAVATTASWGDGTPDIFAAAGAQVLGSDDGAAFAPLPGVPDLGSQGAAHLAWAGGPTPRLLVATGAQAGFSVLPTTDWYQGASGTPRSFRAAAPGGQSVAYVLGEDGALLRTLSAGFEPATLTASKSRLAAGASTKLRATGRIAARGALRLRSRPPGGSWQSVRSWAWRDADWERTVSLEAAPSLTREYRLEFVYGDSVTPVAPVLTVTVSPRIKTAKASYTVRRGTVFRFSGSVSPQLRGERVQLLTDRGGKWRPVSGQSWVRLQNGRRWTSRAFGTPVAETYRLRAYLPATSKHGASYSRIVKVTVRR